jgi:hypothetical protein
MANGPQKLQFTVGNHRYIIREHTLRKVRLKGERTSEYYSHNQVASEIHITREATFDVVIDVPALIDLIVARARSNRSGKAKLLDGLAIAKIRGKPLEIQRHIDEKPLDERYELVEQKA